MSETGKATRPLAFATVALGVAGGGLLITTALLSHRGPLVLVSYAALILAVGLFLRSKAVQPFYRRFSLSLGSFMTATLIFYIFVATVQTNSLFNVSLPGHAWRIGLMLLIGGIISAATAQLTTRRTPLHRPLQ